MAITKLMHMKESSLKSASIHLKNCIKYIENEDKTEHGMYIAANNCHLETAFEEMIETKNTMEKRTSGRDIILSYHLNREKLMKVQPLTLLTNLYGNI